MKINNIIVGIVGIMICAIMIGGAFLPAISNATMTEKTFDNREGSLFEMVELNESSTYTFEWKYTDPTNAIVNGEPISLVSASIICDAGTFLIRYGSDSNGYYLQGVGSTDIFVTSGGSTPKDLTITIANGTFTATATDSTPVTTSISDGFAIAPSGDWVMKSSNQSAYVLKDSRIVAMGLTFMDVWNRGFYIDGTVENVNVSCFNSTDFTISNVVVNSNVESNYIDLYTLDSITFDASNDTNSWHATYNYFIVPAEVTAKLTYAPSNAIISMFSVLPIVAIAGLVMVGIYVFISRK